MAVPDRSEIVIIGGGVVGVSIAYHLARRGRTDVTLVERRSLTHGSTWHAAGLVGQLRSSSNLTQLMRRSVETYRTLEEETGYATGWREVGGVRVASSPERWQELQRVCTQGKSYGFDVHLVSPGEARELFPLLELDGVHGATWTPTDGYVDPSQLTHSFAAGARAAGVRIVQNCRVESIERAGRRVTAVVTDQGRIECDVAVNATGMWGAETARLAGVDVAVNAVEHQYVVTEKTPEVPRDLPTFRDPDARFYLKPEAGALVIGGWEEGTRACWRTIPRELGPELFEPDHDRFEGLAEGAAHRVPIFGELGIQTWVNGPIPFSPDAEPIMGLTEDLDNLFHCCGFSAGIAAAGGAGEAMAAWIVDGDPGLDLWPFDVRRFGSPHNVPFVLDRLSVESYGHYYDIAFPNRPSHPPRGQRRSAVWDRLRERGAVFGSKFGYERAQWFTPGEVDREEEPTFGRGEAWERVAAEHAAVREAVGVVDQSSFTKLEVRGPGALALLQRVAGGQLDVAVGRIVYTQLLNQRGGIEADVTVTRLGSERFYVVTGSAFGRHDVTFLLQHAPDDGSVTIEDVSSAYGVLNVCGPRSRDVLTSLSASDFSADGFRYMTARHVDVGWAPALALRATYVGELGWELHVPTEYVRGLYDQLLEAGEPHRIADVGYRAVETLRLEKQFLAWAGDIRSDDDPYAAGLAFAVRPDKPELLAGPALRAIRDAGPTRRLCWFSADPDDLGELVMHGGELLAHTASGTLATVRSAGFGHTVGRFVFSAYLPASVAGDQGEGEPEGDFEVEVMGRRFPARRHLRPLYDPAGERVRS
ncbi:GcvT family protein [Nocardioides flavescens]|uniref:FAD-dependent oxidoreductase n=1 Tax=Nocardioides flavescens TaxID=2691959 RepID=A0A6L7F359_9ACTN|nr:FAD-dependent oxidoreductase [Nocardioides flavescens]MXG91144.1 FAD-dependent oxidoreductase [Nocardioides flavescens]